MESRFICFSILFSYIIYLFLNHEPHEPILTENVENIRKSLKPIIPPDEYERIKVYDMFEKYNSDVAYTQQKSKIWICTKSKEGVPESKEVLTYVLMHEYAHAITPDSIQHDAKFLKSFRELIHKADLHNIKYKVSNRICGKCVDGTC